MLHLIFNLIMESRARAIFRRVQSFLPSFGKVLDLGSGTGHFAQILREHTSLSVLEADTTNMNVFGPWPVIIHGPDLPFQDEEFSAVLIFFVLQYVVHPKIFLREAARISSGPIVVLQSTYCGRLAAFYLYLRELFQGRGAFLLARLARIVSSKADNTLIPRSYHTRDSLQKLFLEAKVEVVHFLPERFALCGVRKDLYILEPQLHIRSQ